MAVIPNTVPVGNSDGFISGSATVTVNETVSAVQKNEPIFGVANSSIAAYVAIKLYEQHQASVINGSPTTGQGRELYAGESYASGKPYVMGEAVWATGADQTA